MRSFSTHAAAGGTAGATGARFGDCHTGPAHHREDRKELVHALTAALFAGSGVPAGKDNPFELRPTLPALVLEDGHSASPPKNIAKVRGAGNSPQAWIRSSGLPIGAFFLAFLKARGTKTA
jgi:hypothetical protein